MIMKVTKWQKVEGHEHYEDMFYEGDYARVGKSGAGMVFHVDKAVGSGHTVDLPHGDENERYDIYLMENGRTFEHYSL
jgi:hypothetical protein